MSLQSWGEGRHKKKTNSISGEKHCVLQILCAVVEATELRGRCGVILSEVGPGSPAEEAAKPAECQSKVLALKCLPSVGPGDCFILGCARLYSPHSAFAVTALVSPNHCCPSSEVIGPGGWTCPDLRLLPCKPDLGGHQVVPRTLYFCNFLPILESHSQKCQVA